ncbi:MobF family relaxase [Nonomuraea endophytica]|uniref:MobF family relaxase n=1 Tax=Nonomuraea endophytica TaxID=714136 RepID=UPI0037C8BA9A
MNTIGPAQQQVEYRLAEGAGCGLAPASEPVPGDEHGRERAAGDGQVAYRLGDGRALMWIGEGLREVGLTPLTPLTPDQHDAARALMDGINPSTGEVLVAPKMAADPRAKLPGEPLVAALEAAAAAHGVTVERLLSGRPKAAARAAQLVRGVARQGQAHLIRIHDVEQLAAAAGLDLAPVHDAKDLAFARRWRDAMVRVGNRGYDLTLDVTKSVSVLYGLADPVFAAAIGDVFASAVAETVAAVEGWTGYGQRGQQGSGKLAARTPSTGLLGWVLWHRTARPVDGQVPDPHLHAHVQIANLVRSAEDGRWSAVAAGGRDLHRHAHAADALLKARLRRVLTDRYGICWRRDERTGAWEIAAIGESVRAVYSKRAGQVAVRLRRRGLDPAHSSRLAVKTASAASRQGKGRELGEAELRACWHAQLDQAAGAAPGSGTGRALVGSCRTGAVLPERPSPAEIAQWIWRPEHGLTGHAKTVTRADVLAAVMDACPDGVTDLADAERLTDEVLAHTPAIRLADAGARHLVNSQRYTTIDILAAEQVVLTQVRARYGTGAAVVDATAAALAIDAHQAVAGFAFSPTQRQVLERLLRAGHGVEAVIGAAGAGKTALMAAARTAWESRGLVVAGAATAAVAAANLAAESGIVSATVTSWLKRIGEGRGLSGVDVLVVDEAAMVDDRQLAALLAEASRTTTKVVLIGDPLQLRAIGVGGAFAAIHRQVDGLTLSENRRQRDPLERRALQLWRAGQRRTALNTWADGGRVHAGDGADDTLARLIADWANMRRPYRDRPQAVHEELAGVLVLAGTNEAADRLNLAARAIRRELGELSGPDRWYGIAGGGSIALAVGDHVRVRRNDYRTRAGEGDVVLNGYRGQVSAIDERGRVRVEWRTTGPDGERLRARWLTPAYIAAGGLTYGTAMTVAAAQGLTSDHALISGLGLDPHTLYAAMSRDRYSAHLYLPLQLLETDADRATHGPVRGEADALQRALAAYARTLHGDRADRLLTPEPDPITHQHQHTNHELDLRGPGRDGPDAPAADGGERRARQAAEQALAQDEAENRQAVQRAAVLHSLTHTPGQVGLLTYQQLAARQATLTDQIATAEQAWASAEDEARRYTAEGGGPAESALHTERDQLAVQACRITAAADADQCLRQVKQDFLDNRRKAAQIRTELGRLGKLLPAHRARRRTLNTELDRLTEQRAALCQAGPGLAETARQTAAQAPPQATGTSILRKHDALERDWETTQRAARNNDVAAARNRAERARHQHDQAAAELATVHAEIERRADLPPDTRALERDARAQHARGIAEQAPAARVPQPAQERGRQARSTGRGQAYHPPEVDLGRRQSRYR